MSILGKIKRGIVLAPSRVVIYGPEGVGKTTLASHFPSPLFLDTENGSNHIDVDRLPIDSLATFDAALAELAEGEHDYKTLVVDSVDWLESIVTRQIVADAKSPAITSIESFGYGKGYVELARRVQELLGRLNAVADSGMHVVLLGHSRRVKFELPEGAGSYDKYELKLSRHVAPLVKEWATDLLFLNFITVIQDGKGQGGNKRQLYTEPQAPWEAKNRHSLPAIMPADGAALSDRLFPALAPKPALAEQVAAIVDGYALDAVLAYLESKGQLTDGQTLADLPKDFARAVVAHPARFRNALDAYIGKEAANV